MANLNNQTSLDSLPTLLTSPQSSSGENNQPISLPKPLRKCTFCGSTEHDRRYHNQPSNPTTLTSVSEASATTPCPPLLPSNPFSHHDVIDFFSDIRHSISRFDQTRNVSTFKGDREIIESHEGSDVSSGIT